MGNVKCAIQPTRQNRVTIDTMKGATTRGKIPLSDRPTIVARYESGESIASISRSFGCTAPAIRYLIKRAKGTLSRDNETGHRRIPGGHALPSGLEITRTLTPALGRNHFRSPLGNIKNARSENFDRSLRDRISGDVAAFLVALDAATSELSRLNIETLVQATDRLLQACARTRMALDRLRTAPSKPGAASGGRSKRLPHPAAGKARRQRGKAAAKSG